MTIHDLYGYIGENDIEIACTVVEKCLNMQAEAHESSYIGEYYKFGDFKENFTLQNNYDEFEQEWMEEEFQEYPILLYANKPSNAHAVEKQLLGTGKFKLLRRKER